ncbi:superoxide dismutase family protein [Streptomyces sp. ISL-12]|uniref:superoxide dismutase family protein n=1 Tax=Streptomyces sp. ISL-12 TaxID=2819177 RepID=UPI001BE5583A|nr:superoxide dismutase family protein [Streptomyces sp. ISL-12]MBT2414585.1 superoxide dismutase family protein [Streptomyces sp. ISL-12]
MVAGICAGAVAAAVLATGAPGGADDLSLRTDARFAAPGDGASRKALTYDRDLVPPGSWIEVRQHTDRGGATTVRLRVRGLDPGHAYGAHVHQKPCGADPAAAGGHYQHRPSTDPADANPHNEVWLDFTPDAHGEGRAHARHDWGFRPGEASSVVIHDRPGNSGARVACFTVPFRPTG